MKLAGFQGTTLIDYPGRVAATLFSVGCNFRCPFCHNAELVLPERERGLSLFEPDDVLEALSRRAGFLDGVVLSGGEPTLQEDLEAFAARLKELGLLVKLDTNGSRPERVSALLDRGLLDAVAIDVKAPPDRYSEFAGPDAAPDAVGETITLLKSSSVEYELRTTVAPGLASDDIVRIVEWITPAATYFLQGFRVPDEGEKGLLDPSWAARPALGRSELQAIWKVISPSFDDGGVRA